MLNEKFSFKLIKTLHLIIKILSLLGTYFKHKIKKKIHKLKKIDINICKFCIYKVENFKSWVGWYINKSNHQTCLKLLNMIFWAINYYLEKKKNPKILALKFENFSICLNTKEVNIALKWSR